MKNEKKTVLQNYYLLPLLLGVTQFCLLFIALFNSGYFFEKKIICSAIIIIIFWGSLFVVETLKGKIILNIYNIVLFFLFFCLCFYLIRQTWFLNYLRLDAIKCFFEGKTFIDPLFHSAIAESFVTNGYPSIQQNSSLFLAYHCLSHQIVAIISKLLNIPCFITYNYLFPIIFVPLFLFLIQKIISIGKEYVLKESFLSFNDYIILCAVICGFFTKKIQHNIGCFIYSAIFCSESSLIAIIIIFLYIIIIAKGYSRITYFEKINIFLLVPLFILVLSYSKISFGIIFASGLSYYVFRKNFPKNANWFLSFFYLSVFSLYYIALKKLTNSYPNPNKNITIHFFHFVKTYCKGNIYILPHYLFLFFPIVSTIIYQKKIIFNEIFRYKRKTIFTEMSFILMITACLPGIIMTLPGGAAFYFVIPVYLLSWLVFICSNSKDVFSFFTLSLPIGKRVIKVSFLLFIISILSFSFYYKELYFRKTIVQTIRSRITLFSFKNDFPQNMNKLLCPVELVDGNEYVLLNNIRDEISSSPKEYCVFLADDSMIIDQFDSFLNIIHPPVYYVRPYLAISAYLGLPVINSIYERNGYFYRGDGKILGTYNAFNAYSMPPAFCKEKVTEDTMIERAKIIGRKYIVYLNKNGYKIIKIE